MRHVPGTLLATTLVASGLLLSSTPARADRDGDRNRNMPPFEVDPFWPLPLPAPADSAGVAHPWVQGEIAGTCVDQHDNVYTFNRAWEVGLTLNGTLQGNESGAIDGNDATPTAIPSPPVVAFDSDGHTVAGWGNPSLIQTGPATGFAAYLPHGAHGCYADYTGMLWVGGNGDGIIQEYNPVASNASGPGAFGGSSASPTPNQGATYTMQLGQKANCDGPATTSNPFSSCGSASRAATAGDPFRTTDYNNSHTLLNEPPDISVDPGVGPVSGTRGDIYVADGYGNHRIVVFNHKGQYVGQWGTSCTMGGLPNPVNSQNCDPGTFGASGGGHPHCVVLGNDNLVYVCDRPNSRIQVFEKTCAKVATPATPAVFPSTTPVNPGTQPVCAPVRIINIGNNAGDVVLNKISGDFPPYTVGGPVGNVDPPLSAANGGLPTDSWQQEALHQRGNSSGPAAILQQGTRACDIDLWPNIDNLATFSPERVVGIVDVDLGSDNVWLLNFANGLVTGALGSCGMLPCPGHNAGHFAFAHTVSSDSRGNIYVAETITGRRIQKFVHW
jgi:NHL repeat